MFRADGEVIAVQAFSLILVVSIAYGKGICEASQPRRARCTHEVEPAARVVVQVVSMLDTLKSWVVNGGRMALAGAPPASITAHGGQASHTNQPPLLRLGIQ